MKLTYRLMLAKTKQIEELTPKEQEQARLEPITIQILQENQGLAAIRAAGSEPIGLPAMLTRIFEQAEYHRVAISATHFVPWFSRYWRQTVAVTVILLAFLAAAALLFYPRHAGWAVSEGYILRCTVEIPSYLSVGEYNSYPSPFLTLEEAVDEWVELNADDASMSLDTPLASRSETRTTKAYPLKMELLVDVTLRSGDSRLLAELIELINRLDYAAVSKVVNKEWIYHERYPELFVEGGIITINGTDYAFPQEFTAEQVETLLWPIQAFKNTAYKRGYFAYCDLGDDERFDLGTVFEAELVEENHIVISTIMHEPLLPEEEIKVAKGFGTIDREGDMTDEEAIEQLRRTAKMPMPQTEEDWKVMGFSVLVPLLPPERWQAALDDDSAAELSEAEAEQMIPRFLQIEQVFKQWLDTHQGLKAKVTRKELMGKAARERWWGFARPVPPSHLTKTGWDFENTPIALKATVWIVDDKAQADLLQTLKQAPLVHEPLVAPKLWFESEELD